MIGLVAQETADNTQRIPRHHQNPTRPHLHNISHRAIKLELHGLPTLKTPHQLTSLTLVGFIIEKLIVGRIALRNLIATPVGIVQDVPSIAQHAEVDHGGGDRVARGWCGSVVYVFLADQAVGVETWLAFCDNVSVKVPVGAVAAAVEDPHVVVVTAYTQPGAVALAASPFARKARVTHLNVNQLLGLVRVKPALILTQACCNVVVKVRAQALPGLNVQYN